MPSRGSSYELLGTVFSKITKEKQDGKYFEKVDKVIGELAPSKISLGCTASKLSIPIPSSPAIRIRMGFQGPTLQMVIYLHTYEYYKDNDIIYNELSKCNWYNAWKNDIEIEDLIKVSSSDDNIVPTGFGNACNMDGYTLMDDNIPSAWSVLPHLKPGTYWWVRKRDIIREAGWMDKFRLELDLERSWQWSTSGRQRPAYDVDEMECFKDKATGYKKITTEYAVV